MSARSGVSTSLVYCICQTTTGSIVFCFFLLTPASEHDVIFGPIAPEKPVAELDPSDSPKIAASQSQADAPSALASMARYIGPV